MGAMIAVQPNGLYCRYSTIIGNITDYNMTAKDYIELKAEEARESARKVLENHLHSFEEVVECMERSVEFDRVPEDEWKKLLEEMSSNIQTEKEVSKLENDKRLESSPISKLWSNFQGKSEIKEQ